MAPLPTRPSRHVGPDAPCRTFHDIARPFLYEIVYIRSRKAFDSFFCVKGFKRGGRMGKADWRKDDYAHVKHFRLESGFQIKDFELPFDLSKHSLNPFPRLETLSLNFMSVDAGGAFATDFLGAFRCTTPAIVVIKTLGMDIDLELGEAWNLWGRCPRTQSFVVAPVLADRLHGWLEARRAEGHRAELSVYNVFEPPRDPVFPSEPWLGLLTCASLCSPAPLIWRLCINQLYSQTTE